MLAQAALIEDGCRHGEAFERQARLHGGVLLAEIVPIAGRVTPGA
jgi:hypothetical protein